MRIKTFLFLAFALTACGQTPTSAREPGAGSPPVSVPVTADIFSGTWAWTLTPPDEAATQGRIVWNERQPQGGGFVVSGTRLDCRDAGQPGTCQTNGTARLTYDGESLLFDMQYSQGGADAAFQGQDDDKQLEQAGGVSVLRGSGTVLAGPFGKGADFTLSGPR